jgi:hypothetical protein
VLHRTEYNSKLEELTSKKIAACQGMRNKFQTPKIEHNEGPNDILEYQYGVASGNRLLESIFELTQRPRTK